MSFFGRLFATVHSVGGAVSAAVMEGNSTPFERLAWLKSDADRLDALAVASRTLTFEERYTEAQFVLDHAADIKPLGLIERRIDLARMRQLPEPELALVRQACDAFPKDPAWRSRLAELLIEFEQPAEALAALDATVEQSRVLDTTRAHVLAELGRFAEAQALAQELARYWDEAARGSLMEGGMLDASHHHGRCLDVLEQIAAAEQGLGGRVLANAASGRLDRHAHQNYTAIGLALMDEGKGSSIAPLALPDEHADDALKADPSGVDALCAAGIAALRLGDLGRAGARFRKAHDKDVQHFPAALGLGATLRLQQHDALKAIDSLPEPTPLSSLAGLLPDLGALTADERRVVFASAWPLRSVLDQLAQAGLTIRVLPLAGRADLSSSEDPSHTVRIEDLLDTASEGQAWHLAYLLGALAHPLLPAHARGELQSLHQRATAHEWAVGTWAQLDAPALFGSAYQGWLQRKYGSKWAPKRDQEGLVKDLEALITRIAATD
jgi:tetratricopeptide (TPR) repeat protein